MSLREEDRSKSNCPSRGLGVAAAAIGVGVGAALYYFFSKRTENPEEGAATGEWSCEQPHTFRERSWTLEECSICFDVMLKTQEVMTLPCTHNFHAQCIMPWLQEKQTCPNCRKVAE